MADLSLLCVHAHPDDEAIWTGGALARYADAGARTAVVTCTWAEGTRRAEELERSLAILGAGAPRLLGYAEANGTESAPGAPRLLDAPFDEAVGRLVGHIREFRPDVVVTYDAYGGYGHPDHLHVHRLTLAAVEAAGYDQLYDGDPWRPRALAMATVPRSFVTEIWEELFGVAPTGTLPGVPDDQIDTTLDVKPWADRKWAALLAHESEIERGSTMTMLAALPQAQRDRMLTTEWYIRRDTAPAGPRDAF
ncbi:PIG-L family deacetylase [Nonomuraea sp. NPDC000554]|uniref:PIG-L family deacetylase n=1 Tax=Nonomuraea sp. NPDC000554 TaxID=3154259 RepID=UPI0033213ABD